MLYREAGQFKTSYAADMQVFPIRQDRIALWLLLIAAFIGVPLRPDFELDLPAMLQAIAQHRPAITYLAYPNNPTGNLFDAADMDAIVRAARGPVCQSLVPEESASSTWDP